MYKDEDVREIILNMRIKDYNGQELRLEDERYQAICKLLGLGERSQKIMLDSGIKIAVDKAMLGNDVGGIDFNPNNITLETQGEGIKFKAPENMQAFQNIQINSLKPLIFDMEPVKTLPFFVNTTQ
jgi:hypothetical protein